jgi:Protein of unknown function (DUF2889)
MLVHTRTIEFQSFDEGEHLTVQARLRDDRPWADGERDVASLHDLGLRVRVRKADLTVEEAEATMDRFPHAECPDIIEAFAGLAGVQVGRGYTRAVQERFAGARGCAHLELLARTVGPVVIQAMTSIRAMRRDWAQLDVAEADKARGARPTLFPLNTCHVFCDGGPAEKKLAAGWRPGVGGYPAPPVEVVLRRARDADGVPSDED